MPRWDQLNGACCLDGSPSRITENRMTLGEQHQNYSLSRPAGMLQLWVSELDISSLIIVIQTDKSYSFINKRIPVIAA